MPATPSRRVSKLIGQRFCPIDGEESHAEGCGARFRHATGPLERMRTCHHAGPLPPFVMHAVCITDLCPLREPVAPVHLRYSDGIAHNPLETAVLIAGIGRGKGIGTWIARFVEIEFEVLQGTRVIDWVCRRFTLDELRPTFSPTFGMTVDRLRTLSPIRLADIVRHYADPQAAHDMPP